MLVSSQSTLRKNFHTLPFSFVLWSKAYPMTGTAKSGSLCLGLVVLLIVAFPLVSFEDTTVVFGPENYMRGKGRPVPVTTNFQVANPERVYELRINNGGLNGEFQHVSSAVITLNGVEVVSPSDFSQSVDLIVKPVTLLAENTLTVEVRSAPGSGFTLQILGEAAADATPPTLEFLNPTDGATVNTTTPTFTIAFSDDESGIDLTSYQTFINGVDVTSSTTVTATEATYTPSNPLPAGDNEAMATVADQAGNVQSVVIRFTIAVFRAIPDCAPLSGEVPLQVRFRSRGEFTNGSIIRYRWDFQGDGVFDTSDAVAQDYTFTFEQPGTYDAVLEVTNNLNETTVDTCTITVTGNPPVAIADVMPSNGPVPLTVLFTGIGRKQNGTIVLHEWDFDGDGVFDFATNTFDAGQDTVSMVEHT